MGECHSVAEHPSSLLEDLERAHNLGKPLEDCCASKPLPPQRWDRVELEDPKAVQSVLSRKGFIVCVDSIDALLDELPYELDADLDHLYALPDVVSAANAARPFETPCFQRDVGACCQCRPTRHDTTSVNQDNYACLQIDDMANPWGLYAVSAGHGPHGHLVSTLLVHELPGLLVQNPAIHLDSDLALYQSFVSVGEMALSCQFVDASESGGTLSAVLLRDGFLHVAWVGDSKVVLGRLDCTAGGDKAAGSTVPAASAQYPADRANVCNSGVQQSDTQCVLQTKWPICVDTAGTLRAVELTADHAVRGNVMTHSEVLSTTSRTCDQYVRSVPRVDPADGAGGPPRELLAASLSDQIPRGLTRAIGNSKIQSKTRLRSSIEDQKRNLTSVPEVRRLQVRPEDMFLVLGTGGLWQWVTPEQAVAIVAENSHRPSWFAVDALVSEVQKRSTPNTDLEDLTIIVVYLAGEHHVREDTCGLDISEPGFVALREAQTHLARCGCMPQMPVASALNYSSKRSTKVQSSLATLIVPAKGSSPKY